MTGRKNKKKLKKLKRKRRRKKKNESCCLSLSPMTKRNESARSPSTLSDDLGCVGLNSGPGKHGQRNDDDSALGWPVSDIPSLLERVFLSDPPSRTIDWGIDRFIYLSLCSKMYSMHYSVFMRWETLLSGHPPLFCVDIVD